MSKYNEIKAGYRITVDSWENDGDHNNTKSREGLTKEETAFDIDLLRAYEKHYGNECHGWGGEVDELREACLVDLKAVFAKHAAHVATLYEGAGVGDDDDCMDIASENAYEYMGGSEDYKCRRLERVRVEFIPETVKIQDVTTEFA